MKNLTWVRDLCNHAGFLFGTFGVRTIGKQSLPVRRAISLSVLLVALSGVVSCGGNSSTDDDDDVVVQPQTGENCLSSVNDGNTQLTINGCIVASENGLDVTPLIAGNELLTDSIAAGSSRVYSVPIGSQIVLSSLSGNADLFLYSSPEIVSDNVVCRSNTAYIDDICSDETAVYALVYARETANYRIGASNDCSVLAQNQWVDRQMRDYYLFYDQVPTIDLAGYDSPEALVKDLRVTELDKFSSVASAAQRAQLFSEGTSFGMGYRSRRDTDGNARIARVYKDSPMGRANIKRSDIIVSINNIPWSDVDSKLYLDLTGTRDNPLPTTWVFRDSITGLSKEVVLTKSEYKVNTVIHSQLITHPQYSGEIGYLVFERFLGPSEAELDRVLTRFAENNITDLILDLRYNGGGLTRIARKLVSQIAGPDTDGKLLIEYLNNDKYQSLDLKLDYEPEPQQLGLKRLVVITSSSTASSSEIVINSLRPYIEVVTVGAATLGKPYVSSSREFCGKSLNAIAAESVNANGISVLGGIPADCAATDDLTRDFGVVDSSLEGMAESAAGYLVFGRCDISTQTASVAGKQDAKSFALSFDPDEIELPGAQGL